MPQPITKNLELLDWICKQTQLRIECWHHPGGRQSVSVWTSLDDEDAPSGRGPTHRDALVQAMNHQKSLMAERDA